MSIRKILVPVIGASRDAEVLATSFVIARAFNAHVSALFVKQDPQAAILHFDPPAPPDVIERAVSAIKDAIKNASKIAHLQFEKTSHVARAPIVPHPGSGDGLSCSFVEATGYMTERVSTLAAFSDLVVFGSIDPKRTPEIEEAFVDTLRKSERPVLLSQSVWMKMPSRIALGWDGSGSAMRAISSAIPFLSHAAQVDILMVRKPGEHTPLLRPMKDYLQLHGVTCHEKVIDPDSRPIGETLLEAAKGCGADLLVMGGYGQHGFWREAIFGGVTRHMRDNSDLPILMLH